MQCKIDIPYSVSKLTYLTASQNWHTLQRLKIDIPYRVSAHDVKPHMFDLVSYAFYSGVFVWGEIL